MNTQTPAVLTGNHYDVEYHDFLDRVHDRLFTNTLQGAKPLFTTDAAGLWDLYLDSFADPVERQHHNCRACRKFIERFGALVTIDDAGRTTPALWNEADATELYRPAVAALSKAVRKAKVTGVFLSSDEVWGTPVTGEWCHLSVAPPLGRIFQRTRLLSAEQAMAEKREDFRTVSRALGEFSQAHLETACTLLETDSLYRSEKVLGQAEWLRDLHAACASARGAGKQNVIWLAVAQAPAGFCHPRSSMIGTLLEDIAAGMRYEEVSRRFAEKMHPLRYQRPKAAPKAGTIAQAEKIVEELKAAGALARRFCRLDEVQALWRPAPAEEPAAAGAGVFSHLSPKGKQAAGSNVRVPAQTLTWEKFQRTVLPTAERIEFKAPAVGSYIALVTAVSADAPPILQWDREDARNPVSWYYWNGGSTAASFGLRANQYCEVEAITLKPSMWNGGNEHHGAGVMFVLAGARESKQAGAAIFPENLRSEFHGVRSVIEAYSQSSSIAGMEEPHAAGVMLDKKGTWDVALRVWSGGRSLEYRLDRWD